MPDSTSIDVAILGGGPAGCSAASWLAQLGLSTLLVEREPQLCAALRGLDFRQDWVLGQPASALADLALSYARQVETMPGITLRLGSTAEAARHAAGAWTLQLASGEHVHARALLVATGLRLLRPARYFAVPHPRVLDATALTTRRDTLTPGRALLLGAGDNAAENALFLADRGFDVTLWARGSWRAQVHLINRVEAHPRIQLRLATPLPDGLRPDDTGVTVGDERFDVVAALLGFEPEPSAFRLLSEHDRPHAFVAGDASARWHPCVQTALADGVQAAKLIEQALRPEAASAAPQRFNNRQVIHLQGLRFKANLGILDFERTGPQPIQVDAEVNLGALPIVARDADIGRVLDYRRIRAAIIDECTTEHTDLVEALVGKLSNRLMSLTGVVGVRVKLTKLEIFPDCEVAVSSETGIW
ncbi:FolB domain-containing protein [Roseateles asaccharophilus]|uniref:FolB domain-containing protein n=1 Tax=Roseateles asaccharophilus TaxID=582607 RepID=A0ABU2A1E4_9BURK|nr:FolB domain-containing protein [Roseateles asaccharophilus]